MTYLSFECFDLDYPRLRIDESVRAGDYVLQAYAVLYWFEHVRQGAQSLQDMEFCRTLKSFIKKRANPRFQPPELGKQEFSTPPKKLKAQLPEEYECWIHLNHFQNNRAATSSIKEG